MVGELRVAPLTPFTREMIGNMDTPRSNLLPDRTRPTIEIQWMVAKSPVFLGGVHMPYNSFMVAFNIFQPFGGTGLPAAIFTAAFTRQEPPLGSSYGGGGGGATGARGARGRKTLVKPTVPGWWLTYPSEEYG